MVIRHIFQPLLPLGTEGMAKKDPGDEQSGGGGRHGACKELASLAVADSLVVRENQEVA
jgi:hypothetical protein